jgi:hypothetical protein
MPTKREQIEDIVEAKFDRNGDGSHIVGNSLIQYFVNHYELGLILGILGATADEFTEEFYNVADKTYLIWDANQQKFVNKVTGEDYFIEILVDDFESGDFTGGPWSVVDGGENDWKVGTAAVASGSNGAYISNDGGTSNNYTSIGGPLDVSHMYVDILLPNASNELKIQFDWRCEAEAGFDYGNVFNATTGTTPVANTEVAGGLLIGQAEYNDQSVFATEEIDIPLAQGGTTRRFIFSWRNDSTVQNQPPMAIDNLKILYS